jgi:hypothetical protein
MHNAQNCLIRLFSLKTRHTAIGLVTLRVEAATAQSEQQLGYRPEMFLFSTIQIGCGPTQRSTQRVTEALSPEVRRPGHEAYLNFVTLTLLRLHRVVPDWLQLMRQGSIPLVGLSL